MKFFKNLLITLLQLCRAGRTRTLGPPIEPIMIIENDVAASMAFASRSRRSGGDGDNEFGLSDLPPGQAFPFPVGWEFEHQGSTLSAHGAPGGDPLVPPEDDRDPGSPSEDEEKDLCHDNLDMSFGQQFKEWTEKTAVPGHRGTPHNCPPSTAEGPPPPPPPDPPEDWGCGPFRVRWFDIEAGNHARHSVVITAAQLQWFWVCAVVADPKEPMATHVAIELSNDDHPLVPAPPPGPVWAVAIDNNKNETFFRYHIRARHRNESARWTFSIERANDNSKGSVRVRMAGRIGFVKELGRAVPVE